jgi:prolipoprotein diacylglyceryltransferase
MLRLYGLRLLVALLTFGVGVAAASLLGFGHHNPCGKRVLTYEPVALGEVIHNTALYEGLLLIPLAAVLWWLMRRGAAPGTAAGVFGIWYSVSRFSLDFLRVNDETVLGLTGAQWTCLVIVLPLATYVLLRVRPRMAARVALERAERDDAAAPGASPDGGGDGAGSVSSSAAGSSAGTA